jgi:hypothetical protein
MSVEDEQLKMLQSIDSKLDVLVNYIYKAEKEVPEYMRRLSMFYNDLFHTKILWEQAGQQMPQDFKDGMELMHHRLVECLREETNQGGAFHNTIKRYQAEGRSFAKRREVG